MSEPVLRITPKKYSGETTIVSMRMAKDMLKDLAQIADASGRTRNEMLNLCLEFALNHMEITENTEER